MLASPQRGDDVPTIKGKSATMRGRSSVRPRRRARPAGQRAPQVDPALATFAHEIRTALTGILALSELLATADLGAREREWAATLKSTGEHLADLTTLVVDAAKADARGLVLRNDLFRLPLFAEAVAAALSGRAAAKGLAARIEIAGDLPQLVRGDSVRLRAALENLIDNAVKFTERGEVGLSVSAKRARGGRSRVVFDVSDTGTGLDRIAIGRLFRPFAQASDDVARRYGGSGLGLVSVKRIAQAMGGDLTVTSKPGKGSRFRFEVVLDGAGIGAATAAEADAGAQPVPAAARLSILCAEDNPFGRVILDTILRELGHAVDFVASGEAAVEAAMRGYDAVLMDIMLTGLDGIAASRRIRALPAPAGTIPIIGISGGGKPEDEAEARAAGMDAYLRKPVSARALGATLGQVVTQRAAQATR